MANAVEYGMEEILESRIERYREHSRRMAFLRDVPAPFTADGCRGPPAGAPGAGPVQDCPWCFHMYSPRVWLSVGELVTYKAREASKGEKVRLPLTFNHRSPPQQLMPSLEYGSK